MLVTISNDLLQLSVKSSGAEMVSLKAVNSGDEYIWQGLPEFWPRRAPVLFPIVGKLNDNKYRLNGKEYVLPQHGFARNRMFDLVSATEDKLVFRLKESNETLVSYPFNFELLISYQLIDKKVEVTYEIKNSGTEEMPFTIGGHPGFALPENDNNLDNFVLEFTEEEELKRHLLKEGLFSGDIESMGTMKTLDLSYDLFEKDAVVLKNLASQEVSLKSVSGDYHLKFNFENWPFLGLWTPKKNAPFVCIEPWMGLADSYGFQGNYTEKEGIIMLKSGETFSNNYSFEVLTVK